MIKMMQNVLRVSCVCALISVVVPSAIPIWEFLKREEKTSYIYSIFADEVENYCQNVPEDGGCSVELLKIALDKLKHISDEELDELDPYQRDATNLIWDNLLGGHLAPKNSNNKQSTTPKPNSYEDNLSFDVIDDFGSQEEESAKIDSFYVAEPPRGFIFVPFSEFNQKLNFPVEEKPQIRSGFFPNTLEDSKYVESKTKKPKGFKKPEFKNELPFEIILTTKEKQPEIFEEPDFSEDYFPRTYLTGPSVVKVYPDGSPVRESKYEIPEDEDLNQYKIQQSKIPVL